MEPARYNTGADKLNPKKIKWIISKNWLLLTLIILITNLSAYLFIRWTKPVFEATSEIKMDIQSDAKEFGIGGMLEDNNLGVLSGEIEILKSRLLFQKLIDSLKMDVSYHTLGRFLTDEKYPEIPFLVTYELKDQTWVDEPIKVNFLSPNEFTLESLSDSTSIYTFGEEIENEHLRLKIISTNADIDLQAQDFQFIIHSNDALQNYIDENLNVTLLNLKANTIEISFQDHNRIKARDLVNAINHIYIKYTQEEKSLANKNKIQWINSQLRNIEDDLEGYENYFEEFTIENRTSDLDTDLKKTISGINQIDSQQYQITSSLQLTNQIISNLDSNKVILPSRVLPSNLTTEINNYNNLLLERQQLGLAYNESTFTIKEKDQRIAAIKSSVMDQLQNYAAGLTSNLTNLREKRFQLEKSFTTIPGKNTEFNKNQRFYKLYEEFYLTLIQSKAEFEIAVAGLIPNYKILSPATVSSTAVYPNKIFIQGSGILASFVLCFLFISIKYIFEDKINTIEELEAALPYSIIGSIPKSRSKTELSRLVVDKFPKSGVSESLRSIRTNIQFLIPESGPKVISISSNLGGEGKTFVASNLAVITANSNKKVCLVDLDMRKPKIHKTFGKDELTSIGTSTVLIHKHSVKEALVSSSVPNLDYIPSGPIPPNPSELILNGAFENILEELKKSYDLIILDTPPVGLVTDGILAMKQSDLTILVIRAGYTRIRDLSSINRHLKLSESKISLILNSVNGMGGYGYGYSYGYYNDKE